MVDVIGLVGGSFLVVFGALSVLNHAIIGFLGRWIASRGTTQRASDVELNDVSVAMNRIFGFVLVVLGVGMLGDAL